VLYADVSGSTRLYEEFGDAVARADMAQCLEILEQAAAGLDGETLKTIGDEIMCAFADPVKAALASTEMQATLRKASEENRFKMGTLHIKIGWHFGSVTWNEDELLGEAPVTAQQIIDLAKADEILTSKQSVDAIPQAMFPNVHVINTIEAEAWTGQLEVCRLPWEQTGQETHISESPTLKIEGQKACLVLEYSGKEFRVDANNTSCYMGRAVEADIRVEGNFTSRQHAKISFRHGRFSLRDESVNGTVIVDAQGKVKHLHREEDNLTGSGVLGLGATPEEDPGAAIRYRCE